MASASDGSDAVVPSPFTTLILLPCCHHHHHHHHRESGPIKCPFPNLHNVLPIKWISFSFLGSLMHTHTHNLLQRNCNRKTHNLLTLIHTFRYPEKSAFLWVGHWFCNASKITPTQFEEAVWEGHQIVYIKSVGYWKKRQIPKWVAMIFKEWDAASKRQSYGYYCYYFWGIIAKENGNKRPQDKGKRSTVSVKMGVDHPRGKERNSFFLTLRKGGISGSYLLLTRGSPCNPDCFASNPISR